MRIRIKQVLLAVAFSLVLLLCLPMVALPSGSQTVVATESTTYRITDLGTPGDGSAYAYDMNDHGQVVGMISWHPFLWTFEGGMVELSTLGGNQASASGINNHGQIVGWSTIPGVIWPFGTHATLWTEDGEITDLGVLSGNPQGNSMARDINDQGQVVGQTDISPDPLSPWHAFLWTVESGMVDLGTLGGDYSEARSINELGQIVGRSTTVDGVEHAFFITPMDMDDDGILEWYWDADGDGINDLMMDLEPLGGFSYAEDINEHGQIVGSHTYEDGNLHAFLWTAEGGMQDLGTLGGISSSASAINNLGYIVGQISTEAEEYHPFLWTAEGGIMELDTLGGTRTFTLDINEFNHIVGWGYCPAGKSHALGWWVEGWKNVHAVSNWLRYPVTLDGQISSSEEWSDASSYDVTFNNVTGWWENGRIVTPCPKVMTVWFKNDGEWLYLLYQIPWSADHIHGVTHGLIELFWTEGSDYGGVTYDGRILDLFAWTGSAWSSDTAILDDLPPGTIDVEGAVTHDGHSFWFEFRKRLDSGDGRDWSLHPGDLVGHPDPEAMPAFIMGLYDYDYDADHPYTLEQYLYLQLSQSPTDAVEDLIDDVEEFNLPFGIETSLVRKLVNARTFLERGMEGIAKRMLQAFINQVEDLRGTQLTDEQADALVAAAQGIIVNIG